MTEQIHLSEKAQLICEAIGVVFAFIFIIALLTLLILCSIHKYKQIKNENEKQ